MAVKAGSEGNVAEARASIEWSQVSVKGGTRGVGEVVGYFSP